MTMGDHMNEERALMLEMQVRALRRYLIALLAVMVVVGFVAFRQAPETQRDLVVRSLTVKDSSGNTLATVGGDSSRGLVIYGPHGKTLIGPSGFYVSGDGTATLQASVFGDYAMLSVDGTTPTLTGGSFVTLSVDKSSPTVSMSDAAGFRMDLGSTETTSLVSGGSTTTSAATITMFGNDKDHKVIWQAPH